MTRSLHPAPGPTIRTRRVPASLVALSLAGASAFASAAPERPAALQALEKRGVTVVGTFPAPGGLTAWAGYVGQRPVALYATPDGKHVIAGTLLDADGKEVAKDALEKAVAGPMTDGVWKQLESSRWVEDGKKGAPRTVYVFTDPNCPYCNKFWSDARPWVDSGKVVLRHVIVGILTPTSPGKAAALLADKNPAAALASYERSHAAQNARTLATGRPRPLGDDGLKPLATIPPAIQAQLETNERLMASLGVQATPAMVWRDADGAVQVRTGAEDSALPTILGPR
jgi:thiol:disulfide interchange protein DsbG